LADFLVERAADAYAELLAAWDPVTPALVDLVTAHLTLLNYARGIAVNLEAEREAEAHSGLDSEEWMDTQEPALLALLNTGRYPALARLAATGYDFDLDALFEFGLQRLLDGLATLMGEGPAD
ncbi:TetR/AcrR family transcriptional regulator C-terminal domain-containing protein, partial [Streptomyces sp. NPDC029216]|uniref:TetR/AcrR family transcriptional regulator C-terminal domain-containing protein n=1 Tax=Streptomyces sp. NPDC029216 TaxID=3154701 RepID=UPI0033CD2405